MLLQAQADEPLEGRLAGCLVQSPQFRPEAIRRASHAHGPSRQVLPDWKVPGNPECP